MSVFVRCPQILLKRLIGSIGILACLLGPAACNRPGCDQEDYVVKANAPVITKMDYLYPLPNDPWTLIFAINFSDADGNLGNGNALFYTNGDASPIILQLPDYFEQSNVPLDATSGRFAVHLRFADNVADGSTIRLGTQLEDSSAPDPDGLKSNCYNLDLLFAVEPWTTSLRDTIDTTRRLAGRAWDLLKSAT